MKQLCSIVLVILATAGMMSSCSSSKGLTVSDLNGKWDIVSVQGEKVVKEELPFFEFNIAEKKLHGNSGCNIVNSYITLDDNNANAIKLSMPMTTLMACPYMELENKIGKAMMEITAFKRGEKKNEVLLVDKDGKSLLTLNKK